jgi:hypothetical protein
MKGTSAMGRFVGLLVVACLVAALFASIAHAEMTASGYKNVVSKSYFVPAMMIPGYDAWGQRPGWLPQMNGSHPKPFNGTLDNNDKKDPANIPGVYQKRSAEIVIFSSKRRK